jgi:hypothetical protein
MEVARYFFPVNRRMQFTFLLEPFQSNCHRIQ